MDTPAKLNAVQDLMADMLARYTSLTTKGTLTAAESKILDKIEKWTNKIAGVSLGYQFEYKAFIKHGILKSRTVSDSGGDITIESSLSHSKTVQIKSTIQKEDAVVTRMMQVALNQLAGERGETPKKNARRILDMNILDGQNPWPYTALTPTQTLAHYEETCLKLIKDMLSEAYYTPHTTSVKGMGIPSTVRSWMFDISKLKTSKTIATVGFDGTSRSTRLVSKPPRPLGGGKKKPIFYPESFTIKIRYHEGYIILDDTTLAPKKLQLVVVNAMRDDKTVVTVVSKLVYVGGITIDCSHTW